MSYLEIDNLTKQFGTTTAVDHFNLRVEQGEMVALLGGSGCGKTTILRMIAGFLEPTEGSIRINGKVMNEIPPYKRNVAIFFQNYALFPHLTVYNNIAYGLKQKKLPKAEIQKKVNDFVRLVRLEGLEKRYPRELSGGQQQRVALARALVMEPAVLLLDEPLSNLDAKLRIEMQVEIRQLQKKLNVTTIIVTHDQEEAVSLADKILVMSEGHLLQEGDPREVFNYPANPFLADFMGFTNFIYGTLSDVKDGRYYIRVRGRDEMLVTGGNAPLDLSAGDSVVAAIRPGNVAMAAEAGNDKAGNTFSGRVSAVTYKGNISQVDIQEAFDTPLHMHCADYAGPVEGGKVSVYLPPEKLLIYRAG